MRGQERRTLIMQHMKTAAVTQVADLSELVGVSKMTVHRDLDKLEEQRLVRKVRGGAVLVPSTIFEAEYAYRKHQNIHLKASLAKAMATLIKPGMVIYLDDSTTVSHLGPLLADIGQIVAVTNGAPLINSLKEVDNIELLALGGKYDPVPDAFFGLICDQAIEQLQFDLAFFSCSSIKGNKVYQNGENIVTTKKSAMASANRSVLAFEASKFRLNALHLLAPLQNFDHVFLTNDADASQITELFNSDVDFTSVAIDEHAH